MSADTPSSNGNGAALSGSSPGFFGLNRNKSSDSFHAVPLQALTTEGWLELFLTPSEKRAFSQWREQVDDKSLSHKLIHPLLQRLAMCIPDHIAPNLLTLTGLACMVQAWYITLQYGDTFPKSCTWFAIINILIFYCTHSIDIMHSQKIRQTTPLGDLFKYCCDCNATVFLVIVTTYCLGGDALISWYAVQASQLVLFTKHLSAFHRNAGLRYNVLTGPGEVLFSVMVLLAVRATLGLGWFLNLYNISIHRLMQNLELLGDAVEKVGGDAISNMNITNITDHRLLQAPPSELSIEIIMTMYYIMYATAVIKTLLLHKSHGWTRFGLAASLLMRFVPSIIIRSAVGSSSVSVSILDVICDGCFMAVLTTDVTLAKMAGREIHPWVVLMSFSAVVSNSTILTLVLVYYIAVYADLCSFLNMPLLTVCRNVYCDGVYDLCHIGHKTLFRNALQYGNRLYVGVVGDKDAGSYKRPPIMTHDERCAEVEACKSVTKVIPNAPCFGITQEFIDAHQIHVVAYGEEYLERWPNPDDDPYYGYVRKIGIAKPLPRHNGLSTSDLIRRIQKARSADERNDK